MYARVAGEVLRQHRAREVFELQVGQGLVVEFETAIVGGEQQRAARREQGDGVADEGDMVALDVEVVFHAF